MTEKQQILTLKKVNKQKFDIFCSKQDDYLIIKIVFV